jgi:hypothetical protein
MMTQPTWSALILAALAAVACWSPEDRAACDQVRPVFGARACCERHKAAGLTAFAVAELESARRDEDWLDRRAEDATRPPGPRRRIGAGGVLVDQPPRGLGLRRGDRRDGAEGWQP